MAFAKGTFRSARPRRPLPPATAAAASSTDVGRYLADAARSYLDGIAKLGADHAVTQDRLGQLRRTLERYEQLN